MSDEKPEKKSFYRWLGQHLGRYPGGWFNQAENRLEILDTHVTEAELAALPAERPLDMEIVRVGRFSFESQASTESAT